MTKDLKKREVSRDMDITDSNAQSIVSELEGNEKSKETMYINDKEEEQNTCNKFTRREISGSGSRQACCVYA